MPWFRIDDSFYDHPKVFDAPDCAVALWVRAGTWSARNLTDGFVPTGMPARLCDDPDTAVRELVRRGLWSRSKDGFRFHDWKNYQPTADEVKHLRSKRAEAGRLGGLAKAAKQNGSNVLANASQFGKQNSAPARPGPSPSGLGRGESSATPARASPEPPRTCPRHPNGTPDNCGACADARRGHDSWGHDQVRVKAAAASTAARQRAELRAAEIRQCGMCDQTGYLPSGRACLHDPNRQGRTP